MDAPAVSNVLLDPRLNCRFVVWAYRTLTEQELLATVRMYLAQKRGRVKRNTTVEIVTVFGARDPA